MESRILVFACISSAMAAAAVFTAPAPAPSAEASVPVPADTPVPVASLRPDTPGTLPVISDPPGAEVRLDSDPGPSATPPATLPVSPITHPVMVRLTGFRDHVTSVAVRPGEHAMPAAALVPGS